MAERRIDRGEFADLLRRLRTAASLTQEELAERAGLTSNAIGALERGDRRRPYPHTVRALADALDLGTEHRQALVAAARPQSSAAADPAPALRSSAEPATPTRPGTIVGSTGLIGRDADVEAVLQLLLTKRLVTITGPGGVGKTRLAAAVVERAPAGPASRARPTWVSLAEIDDPALVPAAVAGAFGVGESAPEVMIERLVTMLAPAADPAPRHLLVLDNVEHVVAAAPWVADLVERCPAIVVLATSRTPLRLRSEQEYRLPPLGTPQSSAVTVVGESPAARLFVERVRAVLPGFELTRANAPAVAAICARLDGLPLALELAAAHARLLDPGALLQRLDQAVDTARLRDLPPRQATLRATLDWSRELLTGQEQLLLSALSACTGGFTLETAEQLASDGVIALDALAGLVDQSLVVGPDAGRYRLLEPVRQYTTQQLTPAEAVDVARRHAEVFTRLTAAAGPGLRGRDQREWLDDLQAEVGNLRAALGFWLDTDSPDGAASMLADTWLFWALRGRTAEGLTWCDRVLDHPGFAALGPAPRGAAGAAAAGLRFASGDLHGTRRAAARAVAALQEADATATDRMSEAWLLQAYGELGIGSEAGTAALDAALDRAGSHGERWVLAHALAARATLTAATDLPEASAVLGRAEAVARELDSPFTTATVANIGAALQLAAGDETAALDPLAAAVELALDLDSRWSLVVSYAGLGVLAARRGLPAVAVTLFAAADEARSTDAVAVAVPLHRIAAQQALARCRESLAAEAFDQAWQRGREMEPDEALRLVQLIRNREPS